METNIQLNSEEMKMAVIKAILSNVNETETSNQIRKIEELASEMEMDKSIIHGCLTPKYSFSDFLDEILRSLRLISTREKNFVSKKKDLFFRKKADFNPKHNTFKVWLKECFIEKRLSIVRIVELCQELFSNNHIIPFSFISTQVVRLFYWPTDNSVEFLVQVSKGSHSIDGITSMFPQHSNKGYKDKIIYLTSLILSTKDATIPFNIVNNSVGSQKHSEQNTVDHINKIINHLNFHLLPSGYGAYAHTDYQKNIYLSRKYLPEEEEDYVFMLMSVISLTHEVAHLKRIESALACSPLEFTPPDLNYEAGESIEVKLFGGVVDVEHVQMINSKKILENPNIKNDFLKDLKGSLEPIVSGRSSDVGSQNKILSLPKD